MKNRNFLVLAMYSEGNLTGMIPFGPYTEIEAVAVQDELRARPELVDPTLIRLRTVREWKVKHQQLRGEMTIREASGMDLT